MLKDVGILVVDVVICSYYSYVNPLSLLLMMTTQLRRPNTFVYRLLIRYFSAVDDFLNGSNELIE